MPWRLASWLTMLSALATVLLMVAAAVYFAVFAFGGGLQTALATDAPPQWALSQFEFLSGIIVLYVVAAGVLTVANAVVQLQIGPWWAVVGGLSALVAGAVLLVAGSTASEATYKEIDTVASLGIVGYMGATNVVGLRNGQFDAVTAGFGIASALLLLLAILAAGLVGVLLGALALILYGAWAARLGISARSRLRPVGAPPQPPTQAALQ